MQYITVPNVKAIKYGREHEGLACFPGLGASPDALINCDCHGMGVLEIKCLEKYTNGLFNWQNDNFP